MKELSKVIFIITTALCLSLCGISQAALPTVSSGTLYTHLSADSGVYTEYGGALASDGDNVGFWQDQSGNDSSAQQLTAEQQPVFVENALNGKPVIAFDGDYSTYTSGDNLAIYFGSSLPSLTQPNTVFVVVESANSTGRYIFDGVASSGRQIFATGRNSTTQDWLIWAGAYSYSSPVIKDIMIGHTVVYNGASSKHFINGDFIATVNPGSNSFNSGMRLGSAHDVRNPGPIKVAELIVYAGELSEADISAVNSYLENKYDLAKLLSGPQNTGVGTLIGKFDANDSASLTTVNDGGVVKVNQWDDLAASDAYNLTLTGSEPNQPVLVEEVFPTGTKNVVEFDGTVSIFESELMETPTTLPTTMFVVAKRYSASGASYLFDGLTSETRRACMADGSPLTNSIWAGSYHRSFSVDTGHWQLFTAIYNGSWSQLLIDGKIDAEAEYGAVGTRPFAGLTVGGQNGGGNVLDGAIAEILVYEGALNEATRESVEQDLMTKYGIVPFCGAAYTEYNQMDFDFNCIVDMTDFSIFASQWLESTDPANID